MYFPLIEVSGEIRPLQESADMQKCLNGEPVWYSDWGHREPGKVFARLTFNPYFEWQSGVMMEVLAYP